MPTGLVFKDRNKLSPHYIPKRLPHRDQQISLLHSIYSAMIKNVRNAYPRFTQIIGDTGTGKTCTTIKFGEQLAEQAKKEGVNLKYVYINCKVDGATRYVLFGNLVRKVTPRISTRSLSPEEMIRQLVDYLKSEGMFLLIALDEIDYFIKTNPKEHIIYDLTRITEMSPGEPSPIIGEIFIARSLKWHERLEPGERSTLGMGVIEFPRYSSMQVREILEDRVEEAFQDGVVEEDTLDLVSDVTANPPVNSDIRVGLDLLYYSGNLAENQGFDKVTPDHVRKVYSETNPTITSEDIINLDENSRLILLALIRSLRADESVYVGLRDIRKSYEVVCEEFNAKPTENLEETVQDLVYRNIVDMKSLTELGISGASLVDLEKFLNNLVQRLRQELNEK
ncbi:MAG: AAA family ATPase [Candidatus Bathyarchaeota archaeon]|nr:AAA family ATPase [Candidatus Bathyarchaeota archaeon]